MAIPVKLPVFEGPLDLLMHLIEKNKIDIYDIPIVEITDQYLAYVRQMDHEDMDVTSEFLVMAATLLDIKSRMLLPREKDEETGEEEADPREELVRRLLEYKMFKYMSEELAVCREQAGVRYFRAQDLPREVRSYQPPIDYEDLLRGTDLKRLEKVFGEVLRRKKSRRDPIRSGFGRIKREEVNIDTKTLYIRAYLQAHPQTDFRALLESQESKEEVIVTFLILLELMKVQKVHIVQDSICGKILIEASEAADASAAEAETQVSPESEEPEEVPASPAIEAEAQPASGSEEPEDAPASAEPAEKPDLMSLSLVRGAERISPPVPISMITPFPVAEPERAPEIVHDQPIEAESVPTAEDELTESAEEVAAPAEEEAVPLEEAAAPAEEAAVPLEEAAAPAEEMPAPAEEEAAPEEVMAAPAEEEAAPCFAGRLWCKGLPRHMPSRFSFKSGSVRGFRTGKDSSARRIVHSNPRWERTRLSRLWARRR